MLAGLMTKQKPSRKPTKSTKPAKAAKSAKAKPAAKTAPKTAAKAAPKAATKATKKPVKATKAAKPAKAAAKAAKKPVKAVKPVKAAKPVRAAKAAAKPVAKSKAAPAKGKVAPVKIKASAAKSTAKPTKPAAPARGKRVENGSASSSSQLTLALDNAAKLASAAADAGASAAQGTDGVQGAGGDESGDENQDGEDSEDEPAPLAESPRKIELKALLQASVEQALATARIAHHAAVEGATHEEARPENDKDTRGLEQSYLARGHAQRVAELEAGLASLAEMSVHELADGAPIALGAIVKIDDADHERTFLVAPAGGGMVLPGDITVLTPTSPIGRALLGRGVDDECEVGAGAHARTLTILSVE